MQLNNVFVLYYNNGDPFVVHEQKDKKMT